MTYIIRYAPGSEYVVLDYLIDQGNAGVWPWSVVRALSAQLGERIEAKEGVK